MIALHPNYENSYAPGQVTKVSNDLQKIKVKFYDYVEATVNLDDMYALNHIKYQSDVAMIDRLEREKIGKNVVTRNSYTKNYELGKVLKRVGNAGPQYVIEWSDGQQSLENSNHIFTSYTRRRAIKKDDYALAPVDGKFLPGRVINRVNDRLEIKFYDGTE